MRKSFHATCRTGTMQRLDSLPAEQREKVDFTTWDRKLGAEVAPVACLLDTEDVALFEAHMLEVHGKKRSSIKGEAETLVNAIRRMWKSPRLTEDGKPFEPKDLEPGATVTWRELVPTGETYFDEELGRRVDQREWVERSGQVWSGASYPRSAWVIPFEKRDGELAVCVRQDAHTGAIRHSATWTANGYRDVA